MSIIHLPNGIGYPTGDQLVIAKPLETAGNVWYVDSQTGSDAAAPRGQDDKRPLATIAQAHTNAASGDTIVFLSGHTEILTAVQNITKELVLVGAGMSAGQPTVKFQGNDGTARVFNITAAFCEIRNIWFEAAAVSNSANQINFAGANYFGFRNCYCEMDGNNTVAFLAVAGGSNSTIVIENSTFVSTATSAASQPDSAVAMNVNGLVFLDGMVLDAGTAGFSNYWAFEGVDTFTWLYGLGVSLLRGADMKIIEATKGYLNVQVATEGARVDWCDVPAPS
jgi:hypothetical protein